ncbi:hypothetical protein [Enterobacter sp. CC120223-11]|uniref:hypothetical protein n=1 Tax=Enterobacter sp. CC120223-11 TaxID=1378073 RepID=UPI000BD88620|nr:hypothetical protein [Enterobacter sp. CC120223-11]SNY70258.1 hypothetical protein SAMN02744775_02333 [Enterobacter sp. CC120223-11]
MNRNDIEQLTDELIGEAVISLLKRKAPVSSMALLTELRTMQAVERDPRRRGAFPQVVAYIEGVMVDNNGQEAQAGKMNHQERVQVIAEGTTATGKDNIH